MSWVHAFDDGRPSPRRAWLWNAVLAGSRNSIRWAQTFVTAGRRRAFARAEGSDTVSEYELGRFFLPVGVRLIRMPVQRATLTKTSAVASTRDDQPSLAPHEHTMVNPDAELSNLATGGQWVADLGRMAGPPWRRTIGRGKEEGCFVATRVDFPP